MIADTGALAVGNYRAEVALGFSGVLAAGKHVMLERRNAANGATLETLALCPAGFAQSFVFERVPLAANERLRVITGIVAAAGKVAHGAIRASLLPS